MRNNIFCFKSSLEAWERINEMFLTKEDLPFYKKGNCLYVNDIVVKIEDPVIPDNINFGRYFNYTNKKWLDLIGNYVDLEELNKIKVEIDLSKRNSTRLYNLAMQFNNKHGHGKNCLLSIVFSKRDNSNKSTVVVFLRASEVTKRLILDLLLFQRMGEYVYGKGNFNLVIHFNQMFNDVTVLLMYHVHSNILSILEGYDNDWSQSIKTRLKYMLSCKESDIKYKVYKRAYKVLRPDLYEYPTTLVKNCKLITK